LLPVLGILMAVGPYLSELFNGAHYSMLLQCIR
jgi:hypothetical protein